MKLHHLKKRISKKNKNPVERLGFLLYICDMGKIDKLIFIVGVIFFIVFCGGLTLVILNERGHEKPKNELRIQMNIDDPVVNDTTIVEQNGNNLWPIKVVSVEKNGDPKWVVTTENGVMYYTDKKPKIGDIAFYINNNDDITDKNGRVEVTRR